MNLQPPTATPSRWAWICRCSPSTGRGANSRTELDVELLTELASQCGYKAQALARALGITVRHLQRLFALQFGRGPQGWLNEQRLLAAGQLLREARAVKEVAYHLGFPSTAQLSRDFKHHFGVRPSSLLLRRREP